MKHLLEGTIALTFILFLWGAAVRSFGAGLACPDWPTCHGVWFPPWDPLTYLEWGHRLIASLVGLLTLAVTGATLLISHYRREFGGVAVVALFLLLLQATLGGITVLEQLHPHLVTTHVAVGLLFLSTLLWMRLKIKSVVNMYSPETPTWPFCLTTLLIFSQSILGAWVSSSHAGLACPDFPMCFGEIIPPLEGLVAYQFFHRAGAVLVLCACAWISWLHRNTTGVQLLLIVAVLQFLAGMGNVLLELPTILRIVHLGLATLLYMIALTLTYEKQRVRISDTHQAAH